MFELIIQFVLGTLIFLAGYKLRRAHEQKKIKSLEHQKKYLQDKLHAARDEKKAIVARLIPKFVRRRKGRRASFYLWK